FVDIGTVWRDVRYSRIGDIRYALGPGIRVNTPLGIVRFDAGFNPDPREGEDRTQYYLSMGHAF
ncbi:MAG: BamA/TamA family outer membrane protein, partial [Candidatus Latescibacteria bacterium]|nr:BamA/TamA family outer membrane protein [bacterium]MBD3424753.1 BamA/TamA family outer membrane protein [Candidatus Latescibacterota bacterium]